VPEKYQRGHQLTEQSTTASGNLQYVGVAVEMLLGGPAAAHDESGYPSMAWPMHNQMTHQAVFEDWLFRAYVGGLRLMVLLAVNSEDMLGRGENDIPVVPASAQNVQPQMRARSGNDMEALEYQVAAAYMMQEEIDRRYEHAGYGPKRGWYRIVRTPAQAQEVINEGRLAVVLGSELQHLLNCDLDRPACTPDAIRSGLDRLQAMGVNYIFPVHHKTNQFAGAGLFKIVTTGPEEPCRFASPCNAIGLTSTGRVFVEEMMRHGMLLDTDHMSSRAFDDTMTIAEARHYPVLAGHLISEDMQSVASEQTERARTTAQIQRIFGVGGMVAPMLGAAAEEFTDGATGAVPVPITCVRGTGGSADEFANGYLFARSLAPGNGLRGNGGLLAHGSDWNGIAGAPGPRANAANDPCVVRATLSGKQVREIQPVSYPVHVPRELISAPILENRPARPEIELQSHAEQDELVLDRYEWPRGIRTWDYNREGVAHIGLMPEFMSDLQNVGLTQQELEPLWRSAQGVVDLWRRAQSFADQGAYWVPSQLMDVRPSKAFNAAAKEFLPPAKAGQQIICRTFTEHRLGTVVSGKCEPLESVAVTGTGGPGLPATISMYSNGRCLDVQETAAAQQSFCDGRPTQNWLVTGARDGSWRIQNSGTGECLSYDEQTAAVVLRACGAAAAQAWAVERTGNTFQVHAAGQASRCLDAESTSRSDGVRMQLQAQTVDDTASGDLAFDEVVPSRCRQRWVIEQLRVDDYEVVVTHDAPMAWAVLGRTRSMEVRPGVAICRETAGEMALGTLSVGECTIKEGNKLPRRLKAGFVVLTRP
jgi:microsomal dipeptidase-like Zn-dependent dipeptidase